MKRTFSFAVGEQVRQCLFVAGGVGLVAACYGLVRLAYELYLPDVESDLGLDPSLAGVVSGGASAMYCVAAVTGFFLAARTPRLLVVAAASTAAGGAAGMALSPQAEVFAVFAVVSSAGAGLASPALVELLRRAVSGDRGQRFQVMVNSGTGPGLMLAGALALVLLPNWRLAWAAAALFMVLSAVVVLLSTARAASGHRGYGAVSGASWPNRDWFARHARPILSALLLGAGSAAVWTFGRTVLVEAGASATFSAIAWMGLGQGAGAAAAGWGLGVASPALLFTIAAAVSVAAVVPACVGGAPLRGVRLAQEGRFGHEGELVGRGSAVE